MKLRQWVTASMLALSSIAVVPADAAGTTWKNVKVVAGGYVDGIVAHPTQRGLFYARTDIGGAYRYDTASASWVPLNDATPAANWHLMGIESIAVDPHNAAMLYLVAGMYTNKNVGNAAVLISSNQGASFVASPLPFRTGGNDNGRNTGERLQVDPHLGSVLFYGTLNDAAQGATNGLWKSVDSARSWTRVDSFSALSSDGSGAGVTFLAFDPSSGRKGAATKTLFAGVSTAAAAAAGTTLYRSTDGGAHWSALKGGPTGLMPTHGQIGADGALYITYANAIGPNDMTAGQVWKLSGERWQDITPPNPNNYRFGYGGLAVDPQRPGTLVVMTMDRWKPSDTMFRSTDGGASWIDVGAKATRDARVSPWVAFGKPSAAFGHWAQVALDPFDSAHAIYATGETVWTTHDLTAADRGEATHWSVGADGIEETVPLALISPTSGAALISGLGDICGFVHTELSVSPPKGTMSNPICANGTGLDYAKALPSKIVRVGTGAWGGGTVYGAVSTNGGVDWMPFASQAGSTVGDGTVAISGDGATIVWAPKDAPPSYSTDNGTTWTPTGLPVHPRWQLLSDGAGGKQFYAYEPSTGAFHSSADKGVHWQAAMPLPKKGRVSAVFGINGDLWLASASGVYRSLDAGARWSKVETATAGTSVGFGKAAAGAAYPTIYLAGTVGGTTGVFRSTDAGATWLQINDTSHQWGGVSMVVGDPKTFGTVYVAPNSGRGILYGSASD